MCYPRYLDLGMSGKAWENCTSILASSTLSHSLFSYAVWLFHLIYNGRDSACLSVLPFPQHPFICWSPHLAVRRRGAAVSVRLFELQCECEAVWAADECEAVWEAVSVRLFEKQWAWGCLSGRRVWGCLRSSVSVRLFEKQCEREAVWEAVSVRLFEKQWVWGCLSFSVCVRLFEQQCEW